MPNDEVCVSDRVEVTVFVGDVATENIGDTELVNYFPNPSNGLINLETNFEQGDVNIKIMDALGKVVYANIFKAHQNINTIDLNDLPKGVYLLEVNNEDNKYFGKVILQ